ncbi:MAG: tryptophan synthase subunit beta, partial [Ghiorsea sp.]|nr:tryptophan synthase subunit beta [Ghiorsea sp.]
ALAAGMRIASEMASDKIVLINLSGRGDKDLNTVMQKFGFDTDGEL